MTQKIRKQLERAYVKIENNKHDTICAAIGSQWQESEEAKMFNPNKAFWWGYLTMGVNYVSAEARSARLLGIAFMLTMPKEIKEGKCHK